MEQNGERKGRMSSQGWMDGVKIDLRKLIWIKEMKEIDI